MFMHCKRTLTILSAALAVGLVLGGLSLAEKGGKGGGKPPKDDGGDSAAYHITDLSISGGRGRADAINNFGEVVGQNVELNHATLWRTNVAGDVLEVIDLGTLGGNSSFAYDINDAGQVVGLGTRPSDPDGNPQGSRAFLLTPEDLDGDGNPDLWYRDDDGDGANDLMRDLGALPAGDFSIAWGVNDHGQVVGSASSNAASNGPAVAVLWQLDAQDNVGLTVLSELDDAVAYDINNNGEVAGKEQGFVPVRWKVDAGGNLLSKIDLGTLGGSAGRAFGINQLGEVVGSSRIADGTTHAALWQVDQQGNVSITDLGTLAAKDTSWAFDINLSLQIVGNSSNSKGGDKAFLWQNDQMVDLSKLIDEGGWKQLQAYGMNDAGQIVGFGTKGGENWHAYLLTPK